MRGRTNTTLFRRCEHYFAPFAYLRDVIDRVSTHPMSRIDEFTPCRWKERKVRVHAQFSGTLELSIGVES